MINDNSYDKVLFDNSQFPFYYARKTIIPIPKGPEPVAWHEEMEFKVFRKGRVTISINNNIFEVTKNDIIINDPDNVSNGAYVKSSEKKAVSSDE
jgi:mannose-6-phosphate isomerase-like protein (cupin superfamily)